MDIISPTYIVLALHESQRNHIPPSVSWCFMDAFRAIGSKKTSNRPPTLCCRYHLCRRRAHPNRHACPKQIGRISLETSDACRREGVTHPADGRTFGHVVHAPFITPK